MLSKQILKYRKKLGWSQQKLAEKSKLSLPVIARIEQGASKQPVIQTIIKIADAFNISVDSLLGRKK